ncbi:hypothetical protein [Mesorhizobium sp. KR9-304]|uniref:hypothetical protein n=1 Tax=Mesorhizobium sp. KR9-304 TaxID=3156614 RepID=UPI0032B60FC3
MSSGILEGRDVAFSDLFHKIKHKNHKLTTKEREQVVAFLAKPGSVFDPEAHAAIYVLCLSSEPTAGNVALVERFLPDEVNDYTRAAAITCMFTIWDIFEERHVFYLKDALERVLDEQRHDSSRTALNAALHMMHDHTRYDLSVAIDRALDALFDAVKLEDIVENKEGVAANMFSSACWTLRHVWARRTEQRLTYFDTLAEALEVYRNKEAYLLRPLH